MKRLLNNAYLANPWIFLIIRLVVGGVFFLFGIAKVFAPQEEFYASIRAYQMLPDPIVPLFATVVLIAEIICGLGVILGLYTRITTGALIILLCMFIVAIVQAMMRGIYLPDCGCSGSFIRLGDTPGQVLTRDILMLVGMLWCFFADKAKRFSVDKILS